ncbi:MAG TPA: hypothetical protein ENI56_00295 [Candidatus Kaiserbacteria bacterium]|mgnify:CR=1 FL=1|nr:hypothetical protein [Candidatus Kaiserbacteria bacterium]
MQRSVLLFLLLPALALLGGCAMAPLGMFNGFSKNPMSKLIIVKYPNSNSPPYITSHEYAVIQKMARSCQAQISPQMSSPAESAVASGVVYGTASAIGVGLGSLFLPGTILKQYAGYGGAAGALSGGAYGLIMWSYADVSTVASCARDFVLRHGLMDIYIYPAYVRARHQKVPHQVPRMKKRGTTITTHTNIGRNVRNSGMDYRKESPPMPPP